MIRKYIIMPIVAVSLLHGLSGCGADTTSEQTDYQQYEHEPPTQFPPGESPDRVEEDPSNPQ